MDVKKYRFYLFMLIMVLILVGALIYLYDTLQDKEYRDGTLVWNEWAIVEELT